MCDQVTFVILTQVAVCVQPWPSVNIATDADQVPGTWCQELVAGPVRAPLVPWNLSATIKGNVLVESATMVLGVRNARKVTMVILGVDLVAAT